MKKKLISWLMSGLMWVHGAVIAGIKFDIHGLEERLKENVSVYLDAIPDSERQLDFGFQARITNEVSKALQALGHYDSTIVFSIEDNMSNKDITVVLDIKDGPPILITDVDVQLNGAAAFDPAFATFLKSAPKKGDVLNQGQYDALKSGIQSLAIRRGYFDSDYALTRLEVAPKLKKAYIRLHFNSGSRYHLGQIIYKNSHINEQLLDSILMLKEGNPYLASDLGAYNQALSNTGWFSSVLIEAEFDYMRNNRVPISVYLNPAPSNQLETGIGYSTDSGLRVKFGWMKPWLNRRGHSLHTDLYVSKPKTILGSTYKIPLEGFQHKYYEVQIGFVKHENSNIESFAWSSSVSRHWKYDSGWQGSVHFNWLYTGYTQGTNVNIINLFLPGINFFRVKHQSGAMSSWGGKESITFDVTDRLWGAEINLRRVVWQTSWIRSLNTNNRIIMRLNGGGVFTHEFKRVPPSLRFFAGGDNSIRGYGYELISPKNNIGKPLGGSYITTGSLEYNYRITGNYWVAMFTDVGDTWTNRAPSWNMSVGVGVRWESPIGPVRFDVAHGFKNTRDDFRLHFSLGPEL
ncbi:autotransporter assembly complex protein TamA [Candidatus Enterovibrio altilux]|uniref:autotransporter assembly complex protein TamA n=1 Tax=Candidatus Enterovibrio altilux TaxID=1927128 RepID=UPI001CC25798|nr:autotransporter assembly complex family protein [Candidatus Enterovibrio luxaltus]